MRNVIALFVDEKYVLINSELAGFQYNFGDQKSYFFVLTVKLGSENQKFKFTVLTDYSIRW